MRLTKTQVALLREAAASRLGRCFTTIICGHGGDGALVTRYRGHRQSDAACKLRGAGLLRFVDQHRSHDTKNGWQKHFTSTTWEITEEGRRVLAAI